MHARRRSTPLIIFLAALTAAAGCRDTVAPTTSARPAPSYSPTILDGAHSNGNKSVFFLPPMVGNPTGQSGFGDAVAAGLPVSFRVVQVAGGAASCASMLVREFAPSDVRFSTDHYEANWDTKAQDLDPSCTYRIEVRVGRQLQAFADVDVVSSGSQLKRVDSDEYIPLLDGRTLPIKVRVEQGVTFCTNEHCASEVVTNTPPAGQQYTLVTTSDGENVAAFPANWFDEGVAGTDQIIVTATDVTADLATLPGGCSLGLTKMLAREHCVRFTTEPRVTFTNSVIVGTCVEGPLDDRQLLLKYDLLEAPEFLRNVPLPSSFVCPEDRIGSAVRSSNPIVNVAAATFSRLGRAVNWLMGTKTAYAVDLGVGGSIETGGSFSIVAFGLPASMTKVAGDGQRGATGQVLEVAPTVRVDAVHRHGEESGDVIGADVTCTVTGGLGVLVFGGGTATSAPATDNHDGTYTCPRWRLGPVAGENTLKVDAARLDDVVTVGVLDETGLGRRTFAGSAVFTATGADVVGGSDVLVVTDVNMFGSEWGSGNGRFFSNIVTFSTSAARRAADRVYIDCGHQSQFCGTGFFASSVGALGHPVTNATAALPTPIPADVKVLLLVTPLANYSVDEVNALKAFVSEGGRLIIVGDYTPNYTGLDVLNSLLADLGATMRVTAGQFGGQSVIPAAQIAPHQITDGVTGIGIAGASELSLGREDQMLFYTTVPDDQQHVVGAIAKISFAPISPIG